MSFVSHAIVVAAMLLPGQAKPAQSAMSAQAMYADALAREQTVRVALATTKAPPGSQAGTSRKRCT